MWQCGDAREVRPEPGEIADAGSIEKYGIELAVIVATERFKCASWQPESLTVTQGDPCSETSLLGDIYRRNEQSSAGPDRSGKALGQRRQARLLEGFDVDLPVQHAAAELEELRADALLSQIIGNPKANPPIPAIIPVKKSCWWEGVKSGRFPKAVKLGPRTTAWSVEDIRALIAVVRGEMSSLQSELAMAY